ncbi:Hypothetical protein CINCED_3A016851 [Cinara cedri]|uniref:Uncharacterized protein n=1 Tax=Cinara cedri TaxID=506608 RepID=A0A5E4MZC3_9HEMI|nr:Hypothetical protein CINCED_3A016851 [Cinara cedri]
MYQLQVNEEHAMQSDYTDADIIISDRDSIEECNVDLTMAELVEKSNNSGPYLSKSEQNKINSDAKTFDESLCGSPNEEFQDDVDAQAFEDVLPELSHIVFPRDVYPESILFSRRCRDVPRTNQYRRPIRWGKTVSGFCPRDNCPWKTVTNKFTAAALTVADCAICAELYSEHRCRAFTTADGFCPESDAAAVQRSADARVLSTCFTAATARSPSEFASSAAIRSTAPEPVASCLLSPRHPTTRVPCGRRARKGTRTRDDRTEHCHYECFTSKRARR